MSTETIQNRKYKEEENKKNKEEIIPQVNNIQIPEEMKKSMDKFFVKEEALTEKDIEENIKSRNEEKRIEDLQNIVIEAYQTILKRDPDIGGLKHYSNMLKFKAITVERLYDILRTSPEYVKIHSTDKIQDNKLLSQQLTYCMMGTDRLDEIKDYIPHVIPYVDKFIFIDGGSVDGTVEFLKELSIKNDNKIEVYIHEWQDRFSEQRNNYLNKLKERNYTGWVLTSDTDEHFQLETLKQLKNIIQESENGLNYNSIKFRVKDISVDNNDRNKILSEAINPKYQKLLMFKYDQNLYYEGEPHEVLAGMRFKTKDVELLYEHTRSQMHIYERAIENFYISNSNQYSEKWAEFRWLCTKNNLLTFKEFFKLFKLHALPREIEEWIKAHKDDNNPKTPSDSEIREMAKMYLEIIPNELQNRIEQIQIDTYKKIPIDNYDWDPSLKEDAKMYEKKYGSDESFNPYKRKIKIQPEVTKTMEKITPPKTEISESTETTVIQPNYNIKLTTSSVNPISDKTTYTSSEGKIEIKKSKKPFIFNEDECYHCSSKNEIFDMTIGFDEVKLCKECWIQLSNTIKDYFGQLG